MLSLKEWVAKLGRDVAKLEGMGNYYLIGRVCVAKLEGMGS